MSWWNFSMVRCPPIVIQTPAFGALQIEEPGAPLIPLGYGERVAWLHREPCAEKWRDHRRTDAIEKLAAMEIVRP